MKVKRYLILVISLSALIIMSFQQLKPMETLIQYVEPSKLGIGINHNYTVIDPDIEIKVSWLWKEPSQTDKQGGVQDILFMQWEDPRNQWIGTTTGNSTLGEGGGGPALEVMAQLQHENKGLSYFGVPLKKNGTVTFKLLPANRNREALPPKNITIFFVHPETHFFGKTTLYIIKHTVIQGA